MVSRRTALQTSGAALVTALAGCVTSDTDDEPNNDATNQPREADTTTPTDPTLLADTVAARSVPDGATVAVASPALYALVEKAANADGRVDAPVDLNIEQDEALALGQFEFLQFQGETYEASSSFASAYTEATFVYSLEAVNQSEVEDADEVLRYSSLNEIQRAIADAMLTNGSYVVGYHEAKPDAIEAFEHHGYLRTENATYQIQRLVADSASHHMLHLVPADPGASAQVVTIADGPVPSALRDAVTTAVAEGAASVSNPDEFATFIDSVDYVVTATAVAEVRLAGVAKRVA